MSAAQKNGTVKGAAEQVETAAQAQKQTVEAVVKAGADAIAKGYEQAVALTRKQVEKASAYTPAGYEDVADFGRDNIEAVVAAGGVVTKGVEAIGGAVNSYTQTSLDGGLLAAKKMFVANNLQDVLEVQNAWLHGSVDAAWAEGVRLREMTMKLADEATAPLDARINAAVEPLAKANGA